MLFGEGEYNLDVLKEIVVSSSYMGLNQNIRKCQSEETFYDCTTKHYRYDILRHCGCLPSNARLNDKVNLLKSIQNVRLYINLLTQAPVCSSKQLECVNTINVNGSKCLKPCTGFIITSFTKSERNKNLEDLFPIIMDSYNIYKMITQFPSLDSGKSPQVNKAYFL